ncbi:EFR1 family ferrodoxin [Haloimpatiens lingqiaonensis]|uniref:EFR1 family ferrodoxin n=1 Tax=Haloimpatiens lingqiaonensis TaxID=1380675 RepID=UPI0010FEE0F0|nr:EFR1 family ferrodoxin [Haloimpatiens lingqiaonensis]
MRGAIIYFSGTGNTRYVSEMFKKEFYKNNIECELIDIVKCNKVNLDYEFYIFGSPIYAEMFPDYYMHWVKVNIKNGNGKKAIIFSTQASNSGTGMERLRRMLEKKGFKVAIQKSIPMPNNYYVVAFNKNSKEEKFNICKEAAKKVSNIVKDFLLGEEYIEEVSNIRLGIGTIVYNFFNKYSKNWAKKKLSIDYDKCIKCKKCSENCPTNNINIAENITFNSRCISCQRCIHICPKNAFLYKGKGFEQYKLEK